MGTECRPLDASQLPLVIDLARRIWPAAYAGVLAPGQIDNLLMRIYSAENLTAELAAGHRFWAAYDDGVPVGYASGYRDGTVVWIKKLYVLPQCQGRGIGRILMETIVTAFAPSEEVRLLVNNGNVAAQAFYSRCGFERIAAVPVKMGDFGFTDFVYRRRNHPSPRQVTPT